MARVTTTNYAGSVNTQFAWATAGTDRFSRESDLYKLAQAVEGHDHANGKGLAVARVANGSINTVHLAAGAVDATKISTDAVNAVAIALDAVGALEIAAGAVGTDELGTGAVTNSKIAADAVQQANILNGAVTAAKMGAGAAVGNLGYTPVNKAGDTMTGPLNMAAAQNINSQSIAVAANERIRMTDGTRTWDILAASGSLFLQGLTPGTQGQLAVNSILQFHNGTAWQTVWHAGNDGAGSGLDADTVDGKNPTATPAAGAIPLADGSGKLDAWVTAASGVPSGLGAFVKNAASMPTGWSRCDGGGAPARMNIDGRMLVGAGATFGKTFLEEGAYGAAWSHTPLGTVVITIANATNTEPVESGSTEDMVTVNHSHGVNSQVFTGSPTEWEIPSRAVVFIQKN